MIVRLLCLYLGHAMWSHFRLPFRFHGRFRRLFMFLVRLGGSRYDEGKGLAVQVLTRTEQFPSWPSRTRSARSPSMDQVRTAEKVSRPSLRTLKSNQPVAFLFYLPIRPN